MSFVDAVGTCFRKYFTFSGRAKRSEFWYFYLFYCLVLIAVLFCTVFDFALEQDVMKSPSPVIFIGLWMIGCLIPLWAVGSRRLHDIGRSGWWQLLAYIPYIGFVGFIVLIVWFARDSKPEGDKYDQ